MQINTSTAKLFNCLEIVEKAMPVRSTIPVISNILLEIGEDELSFSSTNLEMAIKVSMDQQNEHTGKILLPPKIVDIMRYFPTSEVNIDINWDNHRIDIRGGSAHFHLYGSDPRDYPVSILGQNDQAESFSIDKAILKRLLKEVIFSASTEETRPAFNGILFSFNNSMLTLTASDTYRLAIKETGDENWSFENRHCLVPARALRELLRIFGEGEEKIQLSVSENTITFKFERIIFTSRLLEEKYPDVSGVIPGEFITRVAVDRKMFEDTISRAALLAEGKNQAVYLSLKDSKLEARVMSQEGSMEEFLPVEQDGENIELYVNTRFVLDILRIMEDKTMIIDFHGEGGPIIFRLPDDNSYLYLVLPIKKVN